MFRMLAVPHSSLFMVNGEKDIINRHIYNYIYLHRDIYIYSSVLGRVFTRGTTSSFASHSSVVCLSRLIIRGFIIHHLASFPKKSASSVSLVCSSVSSSVFLSHLVHSLVATSIVQHESMAVYHLFRILDGC